MPDDVHAELERLQRENEELRARAGKGTFLKVAKSGGVSVYGLGRYPVTLYQEQWLRLLTMADDIKQFIQEHAGELKKKGEK
ncbi:MAG: hypothetical protein DMD36_15380 [Gemmatimonadetes bacterium]|nr:MAG: hypothetical protein DMD36_15380 [Gemmatimonadota bacterium]